MYIYRRSLEIREMKWMAFLLYNLPMTQAELIMLVLPMLLAMIATSLLG